MSSAWRRIYTFQNVKDIGLGISLSNSKILLIMKIYTNPMPVNILARD